MKIKRLRSKTEELSLNGPHTYLSPRDFLQTLERCWAEEGERGCHDCHHLALGSFHTNGKLPSLFPGARQTCVLSDRPPSGKAVGQIVVHTHQVDPRSQGKYAAMAF